MEGLAIRLVSMVDQHINRKDQRLAEVDKECLSRLTYFAHSRLIALGLPTMFDEDMPQMALHSVISGDRQPRPQDLETADAFENYLRGVVSSKVEALTRRCSFEPIPEDDALPARQTLDPAQTTATNDVVRQLFRLLRERAPDGLIGVIDAWEAVGLNDWQIPILNGDRKSTWRVRQLARRLWVQLNKQLQPAHRKGC